MKLNAVLQYKRDRLAVWKLVVVRFGVLWVASLQSRGLAPPRRRVSTTSFMLTLALLQQTDAIGVLAQAIAQQFSRGPGAALATLPVDLAIEVEPYGMISRERVALTPAAQRLADQISGGGEIP